eukprot:TRINITY_DN2603_c0_g1_i4.p1 TRINITY_DN2603_c0_g1~~TRINITY_DN2603_c0_g1_i4.p1  ORF type:complete len:337 (+),score=92.08 TRINITY_DN2603_c0_g1_i4:604-1614(+)
MIDKFQNYFNTFSGMLYFKNGEFFTDTNFSVTNELGILYGTGIYEIIPVCDSNCFRAKKHIQRFIENCRKIDMDLEFDDDYLEEQVNLLVQKNSIGLGTCTLLATPGNYQGGYWFIPDKFEPNLFISCENRWIPELTNEPAIRVALCPDPRAYTCDIKSTSLLPSLLLLKDLKSKGFEDVIFFDRHNDNVFQSSHGNVFLVKNDVLFTPPVGPKVFDGFTRQEIIKIANKLGLICRIQNFSTDLLKRCDAVFIVSSTQMVLRVRMIDDIEIPEENRIVEAIEDAYLDIMVSECSKVNQISEKIPVSTQLQVEDAIPTNEEKVIKEKEEPFAGIGIK